MESNTFSNGQQLYFYQVSISSDPNVIFLITYALESTVVTTDGGGTAVAQWLRCCATNRKVAGSIPAGVIEIFH